MSWVDRHAGARGCGANADASARGHGAAGETSSDESGGASFTRWRDGIERTPGATRFGWTGRNPFPRFFQIWSPLEVLLTISSARLSPSRSRAAISRTGAALRKTDVRPVAESQTRTADRSPPFRSARSKCPSPSKSAMTNGVDADADLAATSTHRQARHARLPTAKMVLIGECSLATLVPDRPSHSRLVRRNVLE